MTERNSYRVLMIEPGIPLGQATSIATFSSHKEARDYIEGRIFPYPDGTRLIIYYYKAQIGYKWGWKLPELGPPEVGGIEVPHQKRKVSSKYFENYIIQNGIPIEVSQEDIGKTKEQITRAYKPGRISRN